MVVINIKYTENRADERYELTGQTYNEIKNQLYELGLPHGKFLVKDPLDDIWISITDDKLDQNIGYTEIYYFIGTSDNFDSLLKNAVIENNTQKALWFLSQGGDPNGPPEKPLIDIAVGHNNFVLLKALMDAGATINTVRSESLKRIFWDAAATGSDEIADYLIHHAGDFSFSMGRFVYYVYNTPVTAAVSYKRIHMLKSLLNAGAPINQPDHYRYDTALHNAARSGDLEIVSILLDYNADKNLKNKMRQTPEMIAREFRHHDVADFIRDYEHLIKEPAVY